MALPALPRQERVLHGRTLPGTDLTVPRVSPEAIARNLEKVNARIHEHRARIAAFKVRMQCADCTDGETWPACVLQLDHRPGTEKVREVSKMFSLSWDKIAAEISKCDVVCANHHALRTEARRRGTLSA